MKKYESKYVVCPFYLGESGAAIYCEGPCVRSSVKVIFRSADAKTEYRRRYCETMACCCAYGSSLLDSYGVER